MNVAPALLEPLRVARIWGAQSLAPLYPDSERFIGRVGEVWLTGETCRFAIGPFAGQTLGEAWPQMPAEWTGTRLTERPGIPLLAKFIFPGDKLSVQVHPDDAYAQEHESAAGGVGKTEMWYVAAASAGAKVLLGLGVNVTRQKFMRSLSDGTTEQCLEAIPVRAGDSIFVPAGTVHAIGPGVILYEMQQYSDLTYRVFDYNRFGAGGISRELHVEKAMDVMRFGPPAAGEAAPGVVEPIAIQGGPNAERLLLVACRYFAVERWKFSGRVTIETSPERFELLTPLEGTGRFSFPGGLSADVSRAARAAHPPDVGANGAAEEFSYAPGQAWLIPAALGIYILEPSAPTTLLRAYVPNLDALEQELAGGDRTARAARPRGTQQ
ncbi:MAG: class I mannose-6-phosphate isomerase [Candidatus Acidiferrales bacterium]